MGGATEGGRGQVLGLGSRLRAGGEGGGAVVSRSPKVSVRCIGLVFTEDKRGARGSPGGGGLAWWGRGLKLEGEVREGQGPRRGRESSVCTLYIEIQSLYMPAGTPVPPVATLVHCPPPPGVSTCKLGFNPNHNPGGGGGRRRTCLLL